MTRRPKPRCQFDMSRGLLLDYTCRLAMARWVPVTGRDEIQSPDSALRHPGCHGSPACRMATRRPSGSEIGRVAIDGLCDTLLPSSAESGSRSSAAGIRQPFKAVDDNWRLRSKGGLNEDPLGYLRWEIGLRWAPADVLVCTPYLRLSHGHGRGVDFLHRVMVTGRNPIHPAAC